MRPRNGNSWTASSFMPHLCLDRADAVDPGFDPVARQQRPDASRRPGENQVAGRELEESGQLRNSLLDAPDHLRDGPILPAPPVDIQPDALRAQFPDFD